MHSACMGPHQRKGGYEGERREEERRNLTFHSQTASDLGLSILAPWVIAVDSLRQKHRQKEPRGSSKALSLSGSCYIYSGL